MPQPLDIAGLTLTLLRRLLYLWVRPAVLPEKPAELGLDALRPVCYVLDERYLSNLLVLIEEARRAGLPPPRAPLALGPLRARRSFFFLARARRLTQAELGAQVGATRQTINAIEAEKYAPSLELAFRLARNFRLPFEDVFQFDDPA